MKKQKEQYSREISIHKAAFGMDSDACAAEALKLVNSDITGIVFSAAIASGIFSADISKFSTQPMRKGWREIIYMPEKGISIPLCCLGPLKTQSNLLDGEDTIKYSVSFEWYRK